MITDKFDGALPSGSKLIRYNLVRLAQELAASGVPIVAPRLMRRMAKQFGITDDELEHAGLSGKSARFIAPMSPAQWIEYIDANMPKFCLQPHDADSGHMSENKFVKRMAQRHGHDLTNAGRMCLVADTPNGEISALDPDAEAFGFGHHTWNKPDGTKVMVVDGFHGPEFDNGKPLFSNKRHWPNAMARMVLAHAADTGHDAVALPHLSWRNGKVLWVDGDAAYDRSQDGMNPAAIKAAFRRSVESAAPYGATMERQFYPGTGQDLDVIPLSDSVRRRIARAGVTLWGNEPKAVATKAVRIVISKAVKHGA